MLLSKYLTEACCLNRSQIIWSTSTVKHNLPLATETVCERMFSCLYGQYCLTRPSFNYTRSWYPCHVISLQGVLKLARRYWKLARTCNHRTKTVSLVSRCTPYFEFLHRPSNVYYIGMFDNWFAFDVYRLWRSMSCTVANARSSRRLPLSRPMGWHIIIAYACIFLFLLIGLNMLSVCLSVYLSVCHKCALCTKYDRYCCALS